jgi:hypothetical protein
VFSSTKFNKHYESIFPSEYIHPRYDPEVLQGLMDIQSENSQNPCFVIFDDCLDQKAFASQLFLNLTTTYRHYNISIYILSQYLYKVPPTVRECASRVALFRLTTKRSLQACYESFGGFFRNYHEFERFIIDKTPDHSFVWYIANSSDEKIEQVYQVLKVPENVPDIKFEY